MSVIVFPSLENHLSTLIILHGMYSTYVSLLELVYYLQNKNRHLKIILPNAPIRNINWPKGIEKNAPQKPKIPPNTKTASIITTG